MLKKILITISILLIIAVSGFVIWGSTPSGPSAEAISATVSGNGVLVERTNGWMVFRPEQGQAKTGFIFYPGGRVEYRSYAPLLRQIAQKGYLVVLVPMPLNLAVFGTDKAGEVLAAFPQVSSWAIGGHSLGGSMAAQYAIKNVGTLKGLVFWASYPPSAMDQRTDLAILSVSGTNDGLSTPALIQSNKPLLPTSTTYVVIDGGDHAQFGSYGPQSGDNPASIPASQQWQKTVQATADLLQLISGR
jgi:hypothetical protein